jgi:hypothetical protein
VLTGTADFSLEKQFCYGEFYLPLWLNAYTVKEAETKDYLNNHTDKIIAVIDVKNAKCYLKNNSKICAMTTAPATEIDDLNYECNCVEAEKGTKYTFSKKYETNINFVFLGYKYIPINNTTTFRGLSIATDPLDKKDLIIYPYKDGTAIPASISNCKYKDYDECKIYYASGKLEYKYTAGNL